MSRFVSVLCRKNFGSVLRASQIQGTASFKKARCFSVSSARNGSAGEGYHRTSQFDKRILVWTKKYPSVADVPDEVTNVKMKKAKDVFRIRVNIMMAVATVGLCVLYIMSGKRAVERGESIHQQNRDRHFDFKKTD